MLGQPKKEEMNFIERKRQWRAGIDKPLGGRMLVMVAPIIIMSVFILLATPYLPKVSKAILQALGEGAPPQLNLDDVGGEEAKPKEKPAPPRSPEAVMAEFYQKTYEEEGFDWSKAPEIEGSPLETKLVPEREITLKPVPVELPLFEEGLRAGSESPAAAE